MNSDSLIAKAGAEVAETGVWHHVMHEYRKMMYEHIRTLSEKPGFKLEDIKIFTNGQICVLTKRKDVYDGSVPRYPLQGRIALEDIVRELNMGSTNKLRVTEMMVQCNCISDNHTHGVMVLTLERC